VLQVRRLTAGRPLEAEEAPARRPWLPLVLLGAFLVYVVARMIQMTSWAIQALTG
jgi:hypothetical protein